MQGLSNIKFTFEVSLELSLLFINVLVLEQNLPKGEILLI